MERRATFAALTLALAACAAPAPAAKGGLEVGVELDIPSLRPREGELAVAVFRVRNGSDRVCILRDLVLEGAPGSVVTWQFAQPGLLEYAPGKDEWNYDRKRAGKRMPVFNSGLLAPGEGISFRGHVRLLGLPRHFLLNYFDFALSEVSQKVYFESRNEAGTRFARTIGRELQELLTPDPRTDRKGHRVVVFPHAEEVLPTTRAHRIPLNADLDPRPFPLAKAVEKAGGAPPDEFTFCSTLDSWILRHSGRDRMVSASSVTALPRLRALERFAHYLDVTGLSMVQVEFADSTEVLFSDQYRLVAEPRARRYYVFLERSQLVRFFGEVHDSRLEIDVELAPDGGGRLIVTKP